MSSAMANERAATGRTPHPIASLGVVLVAAGRGDRLGSTVPKAFAELAGRTLIEHCLEAICGLPHSGHLVIVVPDARAAEALAIAAAVISSGSAWEVSVVPGGRERHESVRFGLDALPEYVTTVLVHDAARPLAPTELFDRVVDEVLQTGDCAVPALPVVDTLKRVDGAGVVHETVDRAPLVSVQTPQGFPRELLTTAHEQLRRGSDAAQAGDAAGPDAPTDDAEVVQRAGGVVRTVRGDSRAHKLTTREDLELLEALLEHKTAERVPGAPRGGGAA